jgi:DNA-binding NarL/FixJ family response regulator
LKRVLLFRDNYLFATGVEDLLTREDDLLVLGVINNDGDDISLEQEIDLFQPSVIIFDESMFLTYFSFIYIIMKKRPHLRFIVVDERDNLLHIFDKQVTMVAQSADLIDIIRRD